LKKPEKKKTQKKKKGQYIRLDTEHGDLRIIELKYKKQQQTNQS
jgi:hypothetical protein